MDSFSWSDALRACVPCLARQGRSAEGDEHAQQGQTAHTSLSARAELERLLDADDDPEAETLSLHSNIGGGRDRSSRRGAKHGNKGASKTISLWGFNLFGRPGKIALPDSDDEDDHRQQSRPRRQRTVSSGSAISDTADPDASPLADSAILNLARAQEMWEPEVTLEDLAAEEAAQREREERRAARKMRKQMKRAAAALAAGDDGEEFEGFPGSGSYAPNSMPDLRRAQQPVDEFGEFVQAGGSIVSGSGSSNSRSRSSSQPQPQPVDASAEAADVAEADFGGETYAARRAAPSHRSNGGSDTRSGSSGGRRKARSGTSATSSVLAPPTPPAADHSFTQPHQGTPVFAPTPSPRVPEFLGATSPAEGSFPSTGLSPGGGFPSTGLARPKGSPRTLSAAGFRDALGSS